jgi:thiamine pyrophosphokinase
MKFDSSWDVQFLFVLSWAEKYVEPDALQKYFEKLKILNLSAPSVCFVDSNSDFFWNGFSELAAKGGFYWVGDGDSCALQKQSFFEANVYVFPQEKDQSDFALALQVMSPSLLPLQQKFGDTCYTITVEIWGALGGRRDHELANMLEIVKYIEESKSLLRFILSANCICFRGNLTLQLPVGTQFSLISFSPQTVKIDGAKYSGSCFLSSGSVGISNVAIGDLKFETEHNRALFVFTY